MDTEAQILQLKAQVAGLEELLQVQEQVVLEQSEQIEQAMAALQESEHRLRAVFENVMQDAYYRTDTEDRLVWGSPSTARLLGFDSLDELTGRKMQEFHAAPAERQALLDELQAREQVYDYEVELVRRDGGVLVASENATVYRDKSGQVAGVEGIFRDITARKRAEMERERLQQEIIAAQQLALRELSTPIIPIMDAPGGAGGILVMPLIGDVDSARAKDIMRALLAAVRAHRASIVILDITGVPLVDSGVAAHLNKTIQAARLKGAQIIVTGISEDVAEAIVDLGIDWSKLDTLGDLQTGLVVALNSLGLKLVQA